MADQRDDAPALKMIDIHIPVFAYHKKPDGSLENPKPIIYGTAFPIAPGLFATAAHVVNDAKGDGTIGLGHSSGAGQPYVHHDVPQVEVCEPIDFALLSCPGLAHLPTLPIDFDYPLRMLDVVFAYGFPLALDVESVTCIPRAFAGHVVTRRKLYQVAAEPPGYEVSFFAPKGLSGAPLLSQKSGKPLCYGYLIQQATIGLGAETTPVGIAISIETILGVNSKIAHGPLAKLFGKEFTPIPPPAPKPLPGGVHVPNPELEQGWPEHDPSPGEKSMEHK